MWGVLRYTWLAATNIFYLFIVAYVLSALHERPESVIVPVLGMLYVATRTSAIGQAFGYIGMAQALDSMNERLKSLADPEYSRDREEIDENAKAARTAQIKLYIASILQGLIGLLCLWKFFVSI